MQAGLKHIRWEIALALLAKILLLFILWKVCFSHSPSHHLSHEAIRGHVLSPLSATSTEHLQGDHHGI
jgi:hypothetical protein